MGAERPRRLGALFAPSFSPHNANEVYLSCDMSELFHSTNLGESNLGPHARDLGGQAGAGKAHLSAPVIRVAPVSLYHL